MSEKTFYDSYYNTKRWKYLRYKMWMKAHMRCTFCNGLITQSTQYNLDHIKRVPDHFVKGFNFFDESNLRVLCWSCHSRHTQQTNKDVPTVEIRLPSKPQEL